MRSWTEFILSASQPQFAGCAFRPGRPVPICKGKETSGWLKIAVPTLKSSEGANPKAVFKDELP